MERENNFELLRIIACILVVITHTSAIYITYYLNIEGREFFIANIWNSISRPAVPIFVLLSGRYALREKIKIKKEYYKKKFKQIGIPMLSWSCIYIIYLCIVDGFDNIIGYIKSWILGAPFYHLWYLYMSIGLYFLVPYLIKLKEKIGKKKFLYLGIFFLFLGLILQKIEFFLEVNNFFNKVGIFKYIYYISLFQQLKFIKYLGYFILGYSLTGIKFSLKNIGLILVITFVCMILIVQYTRNLNFYSNNYFFVMIIAISLYLFFQNIRLKIACSRISQYTFRIYLVHIIILVLIINNLNIVHRLGVFWGIPILTVVVFIFSFFMAWIIKKMKVKFL